MVYSSDDNRRHPLFRQPLVNVSLCIVTLHRIGFRKGFFLSDSLLAKGAQRNTLQMGAFTFFTTTLNLNVYNNYFYFFRYSMCQYYQKWRIAE